MRERKFTLPPAPRTPRVWYAVSLALNAAFVGALIVFRVQYSQPGPERTFAYLLDIPAAPRLEVVPQPEGSPPPERSLPLIAPRPDVVAITPPAAAVGPVGDSTGRLLLPDTIIGAPAGTPERRSLATLGPRYGDGRLWVPPSAMPGESWPVDRRPLDMDSIVRLRLLAMADSIQRNPILDPSRPITMTFVRNGKTYGLDARGLHLGSITIPAALLALLPMPQGNIDQAAANARLANMRADIMRAAARADAEDDFRRAVQQIRDRNDRERRERRDRDKARPETHP